MMRMSLLLPMMMIYDYHDHENLSIAQNMIDFGPTSNTYAQVVRAQPCANHVQHIERLSRGSVMLRATWYEGTAQLLSLTELKSHLFELYFIG